MSDTVITCPNCGYAIPLSEALTAQLRGRLEAALRAENEARMKEAVAQKQEELTTQLEILRKQIAQTEQRVRGEANLELDLLKSQLAEQQGKTETAQKAELALRKQKAVLEERQRELDLEVARRVDAERQRLEEAIRKTAGEEQVLKLREKEMLIESLRKALEEAKRKSEQGSQELQGEVLELDIQAALERQFPQDHIEPVAKGARGADIVQRVRNDRLEPCGAIVWETKNTKNWSPAWIEKLKADQRAASAAVAVLVSTALPEGMAEFGQLDGVWIASRRAYPALAVALREQLIQVTFARAASEGKHEKMELLYRYLAGDEFRQKIEAIVEAFTALREQLDKERRAMTKHWAEREKQLERVILSTTGMYGALQGIIGKAMPAIPALELDSVELLENEEP